MSVNEEAKHQQEEGHRLAKEEKQSSYLDSREQWIRQHGSARLNKAIDLNLIEESDKVYREERLWWEFDSPAWRYSTPDYDKFREIRNPDERALDALAEARKTAPREVTLMHLEMWAAVEKSGWERGRTRLEVTWKGPVLVSTDFQGKTVLKRIKGICL